jgi:hypothetical protein
MAGLLCTIGGTIAASSLPLYSVWRPQHLNIHFVQDIDSGSAYWQAQTSEPVPARLLNIVNLSEEHRLYPWSEAPSSKTAVAEPVETLKPFLEISNFTNTEKGREVMLNMHSRSGGDWIMLVLPESSGVSGFAIGENLLQAKIATYGAAKGNYAMMFSGTHNRQVSLTVHFAGNQRHKAYILDGSSGNLPDAAGDLLAARTPLATPVHRGDQRILISQVSL